jgi:D-3-phosphoglycerate dehydrogenase
MEERQDFSYVSDVAPDNAAVYAEKFAGRYFFTPKKMGAQTAEANNNAGVAAIEQIINFFEKGDIRFKVNK